MKENSLFENAVGWFFGPLILLIGFANLIFVHAVPGAVFILLSLLFFPPLINRLRNSTGISVPMLTKIVLGIMVLWFTLGVSDLGDMID